MSHRNHRNHGNCFMVPKTSKNSKETKTQFLKMMEFDFIGRISKARFQKFFKENQTFLGRAKRQSRAVPEQSSRDSDGHLKEL